MQQEEHSFIPSYLRRDGLSEKSLKGVWKNSWQNGWDGKKVDLLILENLFPNSVLSVWFSKPLSWIMLYSKYHYCFIANLLTSTSLYCYILSWYWKYSSIFSLWKRGDGCVWKWDGDAKKGLWNVSWDGCIVVFVHLHTRGWVHDYLFVIEWLRSNCMYYTLITKVF